jgi:light-regulated signal transduction histidine kinase (bacteriophytochrome)
VSERKRAQEHLRQPNQDLENRVAQRTAEVEAANKELEAFSYSVSHDLRTPLQTINLSVAVLNKTEDGNLSDKARRSIERISNACHQMGELIGGLLTLAQTARDAATHCYQRPPARRTTST